MKLITRKNAKSLNLKTYYTGKPCVHGHVAERRTDHRNCVVCAKEHTHEWRERNISSSRRVSKQWKIDNPENVKVHEKRRSLKRNKTQERKLFKVKAAAKRRAQERNQTPILTDTEQKRIDGNYELAATLTRIMGMQYDVDHITPIAKGGLHHPDNLRVITHAENLRKGSKLMGEYQ